MNQHCYSSMDYVKWIYRKCTLLLIVITCFTTMFISGCNSGRDSSFPQITHLAFQNEKGGKWGMIGVDGKVLFEGKINYRMDLHPSCAINGVFRTWEFDQVRRFSRLKYYTATEEPEQIGLSEGYKNGGIYSEGMIPVVAYEGRIHYINIAGDTVFSLLPYKGKEFFQVCSFFTEKRAWFMTEDYKCGFINPKGDVVIEPIYDRAYPFHEGKAIVYNRGEDKYIAIDVNGNELWEVAANGGRPQSDLIFDNGYCVLGNFLYDENGERIQRMPAKADYISSFNNGVALFQNKETKQWQQIDTHGNVIGDSQYTRALGNIDELYYVGNTIPGTQRIDDHDEECMNAYIIDKEGNICSQIDNVFRFFSYI